MTTPISLLHACPGDCGKQVPRHKLACKPCWFRVPVEVRQLVTRAFVGRHDHPAEHRAAVLAAMAWLREHPRVAR